MSLSIPFLPPVSAPGETLNMSVVYFDDFLTGCTEDGHKFSTTADKGDWLVSVDAGGTNPIVTDNGDGGVLQIVTDGDDGDRTNCQLNGESFYLQSGRRCSFRTRCKFTNTTQDALIGLSVNSTDAHATAPSDYIAFTLNADADIDYSVATGSSGHNHTDTGADIAAATWVELAFEYDGNGRVTFYVDGNKKASTTSNVPEGAYLSPIFTIESNGATETVDIDYILVVNER
tara:strand:- start:11 stop:703 length:693 start_codon:yes stop_codon:yes gene_type:complete